MRLASLFLLVALMGSAALADDVPPVEQEGPRPAIAVKKKVPYRVVKMLPATNQVLLFDRTKHSHVVAEVGQALDGYTVDAIDEDEVTLIAATGSEVILAAPPVRVRRAKPGASTAGAVSDATLPASAPTSSASIPRTAEAAPVDPYADSAAPPVDGAAPNDALALPADGSVRTASAAGVVQDGGPAPDGPMVHAPIVDGGASDVADYADPGIAAFAEAVGATPPAIEDAPPPPPRSAKPTAAMLSRAELDSALGNFGQLAGSFRAQFTASGLRFDAVADGSLLARAGLRKGDIVTAVDGQPLRSLDDAADLYARAYSVTSTEIQVTRAGKPVTLRVAIQ